jgi:hypothetical protein
VHAISILRLERPDHGDWCPDSWTSVAHYFHIKACTSGPWILSFRRLNFVCTTCLIKDSVQTGTHIVRTVATVFPYLCFGTKSFSLSNTERHLAVLLRPRTVRRFLTLRKVRTESSSRPDGWCLDNWASEQNITLSGWMQIRFLWLGIYAESSRSINLNIKTLKITESLFKSIITWK